ncbi:P-loop containing nucleoside triphosphate hydrolase protein [Ganoderma leucocontextum]|nr:P-loop containing nucleoside triphosphate hydrolase protein [Ganoderma leucocontextum]
MFDLSGIQPSPQPKASQSKLSQLNQHKQNQHTDSKGKGKEKVQPEPPDTRLWVDRHEPTSEEDLAVHKRKVQDVRHWLLEALGNDPSGKLKKYRRILVLTGPAGTAKTATIQVLSREIGFDLLEWRNTMAEQFSRSEGEWNGIEYEGSADKFRTFLGRASTCRPIFASQSSTPQTQSTQGSRISASSASSTSTGSSRQRVILLEDLPNILHSATQSSYHAALEDFVEAPDGGAAPLVLIISDAGLRGEDGEEGGARWKSRSKEAMDVRNVLPPTLLRSPYVTQINFNPIATTYMRTALKAMLDRHFASFPAVGTRPTKDVLDLIVESSNGDIRSAINALQFACTADHSSHKPAKGSKKAKGPSATVMLEAVTRREQSLALFHLLGKIMYNKRKGDPPAQSASAKDIRRDKEIDAALKDPPPLPPHLKDYERKTSRVDVETLYADTPIDASLLSLYIHQNYTQYGTTLDECEALMDSLSWVDSSGGENWYQANPHQFHVVALGTLHALPSPVPRRGQKPFKPAFFETLKQQHEAEDGVRDVQLWLQRLGSSPVSSWGSRDVVLGIGSLWRAGERGGTYAEPIPPTHRNFSQLEFALATGGLPEIAQEGETAPDLPPPQREDRPLAEESITGSYLSDDDIEEW